MSLSEKVAIVTGGEKNITQSNLGEIDVLVSNAPRVNQEHSASTKLSLKDETGTISAKLRGVFLGSKYLVNHLSRNKHTINNIASMRALMCKPNTEADSAFEGAMMALTKALSLNWGLGVRINALLWDG